VALLPTDVAVAKDVVIALAGASAALAGLVLVFMGMVASTLQSFPGATPPPVLAGYERALTATIMAFILALTSLCIDVAWLAAAAGHRLYVATLVLFGISVVGICWSAVALVWPMRSSLRWR
jgi:hypothetical protein